MSTQSVDDLLVRVENSKLGMDIPTDPIPASQEASKPEVIDPQISHDDPIEPEKTLEPANDEEIEPAEDEKEAAQSKDSNENIDEYGNPVKKSRTYTEDEVQKMIRDRLSRGRYEAPIPNSQPTPQPSEVINEDEPWDVQLKKLVKQTMEESQREASERSWREQETRKQAEFESKFTTGMEKYGDFHQVVEGKPITDSMMLAARNLKDPAAFIYGAAKLHPKELERIAQIPDPYTQAAEVGRLHERMVKTNMTVSKAPKPIESPKGTLPNRTAPKLSLEERIHQYAKQKRR